MQDLGVPGDPIDARENEKPPINWHRGLYRIWLLVSTTWILAWTIDFVLSGIEGKLNMRAVRLRQAAREVRRE